MLKVTQQGSGRARTRASPLSESPSWWPGLDGLRGLQLAEKASVPPAPRSFSLNLGKDSDNLCLHFNPRFDALGDVNTIVCNSRDAGAWGVEHRESTFPFLPGSVMEVGCGLGPGARGGGGRSWL